jgi:hypothetical protein
MASRRERGRGEYKCGVCGHFPKKEVHNCDEVKAKFEVRGVIA